METALVGAFERDNFGDLLFPWVTARLIDDQSFVYLTPFAANTNDLLARNVQRYPDWFRENNPKGVWVVGGEVGGVSAKDAAAMLGGNASPELIADLESPYLPRASRHSTTLDVPVVVNSVGLAFTDRLGSADRLQAVQALREADYVSVRDGASAEWAAGVGVEHVLAPDVVHGIREVWKPGRQQGHVVVQLNRGTLTPERVDFLADQLLDDDAIATSSIRLVAAGVAPFHDDLEALSALAASLRSRKPGFSVEVVGDREPLVIADVIATAGLVVGTSLHVRILAATFDVPRVSLVNQKVSRYCRTWDSSMPFDVSVERLGQAIRQVAGRSPAPLGASLAAQAIESVRGGQRAMCLDPSRANRRLDSLSTYLRELEALVPNDRSIVERGLWRAARFIARLAERART